MHKTHPFDLERSLAIHGGESSAEKKPEQFFGLSLPALAAVLRDVHNQCAQSPTYFECLCTENGLLSEINDSAYAEPRLMVTG